MFKLYEVPGYEEPLRLSEEHAEALGGTEVEVSSSAPSPSANKSEWVAYAVGQGMDKPTAENMTKAALVEQYGG